MLGWPGRVMQREREAGHELTMYNLGIRGDTSSMIASRWRAECEARLPAENWCALVFSFGCNDMAMDDGQLRITVEESVATARQMMAEAKAWLPTLWIGPMPVNDDDAIVNALQNGQYGVVGFRQTRQQAVPLNGVLDHRFKLVIANIVGANIAFRARTNGGYAAMFLVTTGNGD